MLLFVHGRARAARQVARQQRTISPIFALSHAFLALLPGELQVVVVAAREGDVKEA